MKNEEVGGMQVLVWLLSILTVVSLGIAITAFVKVGPINIVSVEVVEHGSNLEKRKTQIKIKYNGYNKSIRPDIDQRLSTKDSKSIKMKVRKSLFGIEYVDEVTHEE